MAVSTIQGPDLGSIKNFCERFPHRIAEFHRDVLLGDIKAVGSAVLRDRNIIHLKDARGSTALHYAALSGQLVAIDYLLSLGADPKALNGHRGTYTDIFELTCSKDTRNVCGYRAVSYPHIPAVELLKIWCLCAPGQGGTVDASRYEVIPPSSLSVHIHPLAGRFLHGSCKPGQLIGPYTGEYVCPSAALDPSLEILLDPKENLGEDRVVNSAHFLGAYDAESWGDETALAADGGDGVFVDYIGYKGMPSATFIQPTRPVENRAITVDYGESHMVARLTDYVHLSEEDDLKTLRVVQSCYPMLTPGQRHWCEWLLGRPLLVSKWLKTGCLSFPSLIALYASVNQPSFKKGAALLSKVQMNGQAVAFIKFYQQLESVSRRYLALSSYHTFFLETVQELLSFSGCFKGGIGRGLTAILNLDLIIISESREFVFRDPATGLKVFIPLEKGQPIWSPTWEEVLPFELSGRNEFLDSLRAQGFSEEVILFSKNQSLWLLNNPILIALWIEEGTLTIRELALLYKYTSKEGEIFSCFLRSLEPRHVGSFCRLYKAFGKYLLTSSFRENGPTRAFLTFFGIIMQQAKKSSGDFSEGLMHVLDHDFFGPTPDCFGLKARDRDDLLFRIRKTKKNQLQVNFYLS